METMMSQLVIIAIFMVILMVLGEWLQFCQNSDVGAEKLFRELTRVHNGVTRLWICNVLIKKGRSRFSVDANNLVVDTKNYVSEILGLSSL